MRKVKLSGYAVHAPAEKLQLWEYEAAAEPAPTEVLIKVTHNGLCHTDLHMRDNDWGITSYPLIPGHEVVGTVLEAGSEVATFKRGCRIGVGWIRNSCRCCSKCLRGNENLCEEGYTGLIVGPGNFGGFQSIMRAPADFCYHIPDALDSAHAAPLLCAGITVYAPLRKWLTKPGMHVAVMGVGGLGHLAVQFAANMGAQVTAIDVFADKEAQAKSLGATRFVPFNQALDTCRCQFDVIINCASAKVNFGGLLGMLSTDGVVVQVGIPGGNAQIQLPLQDVVFGQKAFAGSIVGGRADMQEMLHFCADKGIAPLIETMPISKVNEAMDYVASGNARYRVVLTMDN